MRRTALKQPHQMLRHFFLGFVRIHILHHAAEQPVSGVDLSAELEEHGYRLSPGTLYPLLHALESDGYLKCASHVQEGRRRLSYTITPRGSSALAQARKQIRELMKEIMAGEYG